jgi:(2Fe-2S) ferredoxin/SAM-dependent methyltransferase
MEPFPYHVFICGQEKLEDKPYCVDRGASQVHRELDRLVHLHKLDETVQVTSCGCLGLCGRGPNLVVYPERTWYSGVTPADVKEIVESHFLEHRPVVRLANADAEQMHLAIMKEGTRRRLLRVEQEEAGVISELLRNLASDFQASRIFLTAVELDLFTAVGDGEVAKTIAEKLGTDPRATEMLLNSLTAMGLLHKVQGVYRNSHDTGRFLRRGLPDDARAACMNWVDLWDRWSTLTECVREGSAMNFNAAGPSSTQAFLASTHKIAAFAAPAIMASLQLSKVTRVLDVGGGSGAHTVAVLRAFEGATAELLDLPQVIRFTTRYIRDAGMEERIRLRAGDFNTDPFGSGFDLVLFSYIMHFTPPETVKRLMAKAFDALVPGGRVVINDYVLNAERTLPRTAAIASLNMLVSTRGGQAYSFDDFNTWLQAAGFTHVTKVALAGPTDVVTAVRPES